MGVHQLIVFLFFLTFKTGFSAEISVFVQMGDSVQLDIQTQELPEFDVLSWTNDKSENIVRFIHASKTVRLHSSYKDRVDFNNKTFSLTLKNMQKTDSGLYTARASGENNKDIICYRVSVIDAVEAPVLTVNSNWSSSDSCTVNFTCRAHDLMIHSSYQNNRCSPEEVTSHINTLTLYCSEESIICNHSNPVSSKKDRIEIKQPCVDNGEDGTGDNKFKLEGSLLSWLPILIGGVCVVILAIVIFLLRKCKKGAQETDNTVYAQVETQEMQKINSDFNTYAVPEQVQDHTHEETRDYRPNTMYCTVGQHQKPADPPETERTIYAAVCKQPKPPTISSDDA